MLQEKNKCLCAQRTAHRYETSAEPHAVPGFSYLTNKTRLEVIHTELHCQPQILFINLLLIQKNHAENTTAIPNSNVYIDIKKVRKK